MFTVTRPIEEASLARWAQKVKRSQLQEILFAAAKPGIISFAMGLPAPELFPVEGLMKASRDVLANDPRALQYGPPFQPLKSQIVRIMAERKVSCCEEQILITTGAQQGLSLLVRLLLEPGGEILTEQMVYTGFHQVFEPYEPLVLSVPTDAGTGIDVEAVASLLSKGARPAFIYAISSGHNPLAVSLTHAKRLRLVELARQYRVPVIEDDPYGFLNYEEVALPPLKAYEEKWVFYVGSFSKILTPGLRVGWLVVPESLITKLSAVKEASDIDTNTFTQRLISRFLEREDLDKHLSRLRREYRVRRDAMAQALRAHFPATAKWAIPDDGVFFWVELPPGVDTLALLVDALERERVAFIPGQAFSIDASNKATNCMRLNFSHSNPELIMDGIARLGHMLRSCSK
ncbi:MAG: PLP-dependent aminotransferase family protein [Ktedonobacteraceae bacterium]|nr:PLP-dependent aminotransferase family protein [Ktedonobacteraceae bacterium]